MKKTATVFVMMMAFLSMPVFSQTKVKEYKVGHIFNVSLPDYMNKTAGLNSAASIQFKNTIKDVAGFIIEDNKEELRLAEMTYGSITEFYDDFIKDFLKDEEKKISKPFSKKVGKTNFIETDVIYFEKESKVELYYFVGIVETPTAFYKILCWSTAENKDKFKSDFQKILYSLKD